MVPSQERDRIIFLLGAGASVPLGMPTTRSLRVRVCDRSKAGRLAAAVYRSAAYRFRISENSVNIEDFLEHLYELQLMLWLAQRSRLPRLLPRLTGAAAMVPYSAWNSLREVQRHVFEILHATCGDCSGKKAQQLWEPILSFVAARQSCVPIFTLNYDWTFEKLVIENKHRYHLVDGFELRGGTWEPSRLDDKLARRKINIRLFKLHGSTNWLPGVMPEKSLSSLSAADQSDDGFPPYLFEMVYPGHAHEMWLGKDAWQLLSDTSRTFGPRIENEPYITLHRAFRKAARRASIIVVIGYSFHDKRVNDIMFEALETNKRRRMVVIDPGIERHNSRTDSSYYEPPFEWLKYTLSNAQWSRVTWGRASFGESVTTQALLRDLRRIGVPPNSA